MISIELYEWQALGPTDDSRLRSYELTDPSMRARAAALSRCGALELTALASGLSIRSFSFVGRVELGDLTVTVRPKVTPSALLTLLRYAYSLKDLRLFDGASFGAGCEGLQDLLIAQLEAEARELLRRGPLRRYVRRNEWLASPRGRVNFVQLARRAAENLVTLPCTHHPRSSDFLLNRVVRAGLELAHRQTRDKVLKRAIASTSALYADLASTTRLDEQVLDIAEGSLDRLSSEYEPVLRLVRLLHDSSRLALERGSLHIDGFMFDMNRFFQALLRRFLTDSLPGWRVDHEQRLRHMMAYAQGHNPRGRKAPTPRPDFSVTTSTRQAYLLDAKYRDLWRTELPRDMLYQLAIYAMSQPGGSTAAILYPTEDAAATEAIVNIADPMSAATRARVALRPVVIPQLVQLLEPEPRLTHRQRQAWAKALVVGGAADP